MCPKVPEGPETRGRFHGKLVAIVLPMSESV